MKSISPFNKGHHKLKFIQIRLRSQSICTSVVCKWDMTPFYYLLRMTKNINLFCPFFLKLSSCSIFNKGHPKKLLMLRSQSICTSVVCTHDQCVTLSHAYRLPRGGRIRKKIVPICIWPPNKFAEIGKKS